MSELNYRAQNSSQTLREGLDEYYAANSTFQFGDFLGMPRETVLAHDVCHIVFGCAATSQDELVIETWTALGCQIPSRKYGEMLRGGLAGNIVRTFGIYRMLRRLMLSGPRVARAILAALRVKKRWPHFAYDGYWNTPLCEIRREFGIRVV